MDSGHVVSPGHAADEHRFQLEPSIFWLGTAGRISHLFGDGDRHRGKLVYPAAVSLETWNDSSPDISHDAALGDVARDRFDGCRRPHVSAAEVESDCQNFSWAKGKPDRTKRFSDAVGRDRFGSHDRSDLPGPIFQHGHPGLPFVHRHPAIAAADARRPARARRDKLGTNQRDVEHDASCLCIHLAGQRAREHVLERADGNHRGHFRSVDAGFQSRTVAQVESSEPDDRPTARGAGRIDCDCDCLPDPAGQVRHWT